MELASGPARMVGVGSLARERPAGALVACVGIEVAPRGHGRKEELGISDRSDRATGHHTSPPRRWRWDVGLANRLAADRASPLEAVHVELNDLLVFVETGGAERAPAVAWEEPAPVHVVLERQGQSPGHVE